MTPALLARATKRLRSIYSSQKSRAKKFGDTIPYTVDDFVAAMTPKLSEPCPYCGARLTPKGFQIDHIQPLARGGAWSLENTQPVCTGCNRRKGSLTHWEYATLLNFLSRFLPEARTNILARLAAGGAWLASKF